MMIMKTKLLMKKNKNKINSQELFLQADKILTLINEIINCLFNYNAII